MSIRKILVPTDFSIHAGLALEHAFGLAQAFNAQVTLFHTYEVPLPVMLEDISFPSGQLASGLEQAAQATLAGAAEYAKRSWRGRAAHFSTELAMGPASLRIVEKARHGGFNLIVMGTHGRSGLAHMLLGSTAERVVCTAECPVFTIRATLGASLNHDPPSADLASAAP